MWNPFKKKTSQAVKSATNAIDQLANRLQTEGRIQDLERELEKVNRNNLTEDEQEAWWQLYGIVAFREGRDVEAQKRFEEAHQRFPDSTQIRFSLGQQYIKTRQIDRAFELFLANVFPALPRDHVLSQVRYAYLWNRYDDGLKMLRPFLKGYQELKILDDHFLYVRGMPFFGTWWSYLAALSVLKKDTKELEMVTEDVTRNCQEYDFDFLKKEFDAILSGHPDVLIPDLENRLVEIPDQFPNGYTRMKIAILRGQHATSQNQAADYLSNVALAENDFRWLEDIRTLAKAEVAFRFDQSELENKYIEEFFSRQRMLFEPDIALNFNLLQYQERLKPKYQMEP